jgi:hypothetical protein
MAMDDSTDAPIRIFFKRNKFLTVDVGMIYYRT